MRKLILPLLFTSTLFAGDIGVVNFANCVSESKMGKKEQEGFENIRKQMAGLMESTEKELKDLTAKFEDPEVLDSLSPKAEEEMKNRYQSLAEDLQRYQNQYYQVLQQANYQMIQKVMGSASRAAEKVAKEKSLDFVLSKDACLFYKGALDLTQSVVTEMDKAFELEKKARKISENGEELSSDAINETQAG
jgi:outer membrane protein